MVTSNRVASRGGHAQRAALARLLAIVSVAAALFVATEGGRPGVPLAEALDSCPAISGYIYHDLNNNGLRDAGEPAIAGDAVELRSAGVIVARAITDATGYYAFLQDSSPSIPSQTTSAKVQWPLTVTDWSGSKSLPQFSPALGALREVVITARAAITSSLKAESLDSDSATITAQVGGVAELRGPASVKTAVSPTVNAGTFEAEAYDGDPNFAGPSGHDFGSHTAADTATTTLTDPGKLAAFTGTGTVSFTAAVLATSRTTGGGNVLTEIHTQASAEVQVVYTYAPATCIKPGEYTVAQPQQPPSFSDGLETRGNLTPISGSRGTDAINVTVTGGDVPDNNFGELKSSIHGCVYVDANNNGVKESGERPIPNVVVTMAGPVSGSQFTGFDGCYLFTGLPAGAYTVSETQPAGYLDGKDTIGLVCPGTTANDQFTAMAVPAATHCPDNNFGELPAPVPTATATPTLTPTPTPTNGCPAGTGTNCQVGVSVTPTRPATTTSATAVSGTRTPTASPAAPSAGDPGAPGAGTGLFEDARRLNIVLLGIVAVAMSGSFVWLAVARRRQLATVAGYHELEDEDDG